MNIKVNKEVYRRINDFYCNVALKYPNTNSIAEIRRNVENVKKSIRKVGTNELLRSKTILSDWEGYNVCRSKETPWYFAYLIENDIIHIYDAEHANNISDNTYVSKRFIPKLKDISTKNTKEAKLQSFGRLLDIMDELREKCPWDKVQTNESLRTNTIEETYELCEAIIKNEPPQIKKELGDLLLHVVFYAKIADEKEQFDIADVCNTLCDKLIFRHPHVFGEVEAKTAGQVEQNWEQIKLKEKGGNKTVLEGVPASLPSIAKAHRIQDKARNAGFDWNQKEDVWPKVEEELNELKDEIHAMDKDRIEAEFGDLFFSLINAARLYKIDPDNALERTNQKFIQRFNYIEQRAKETGKSLKEMTLDEMDVFWQEAKTISQS